MKDLKYLIETEYVDQKKWQEDSTKGFAVYEKLNAKYLPEFKEILYYENQLEYWENKLGVNYFYYHLEYQEKSPLINLHNFELFAPESDWQGMNEWFIEKASEYISKRLIEVGDNEYETRRLKNKVVSFEALKSDFELKFSDTSNPAELIRNELFSFDTNLHLYTFFDSAGVYDNYKNYRIRPDYAKIYPEITNVLRTNNAYQAALYREYLQTEFERSEKKQNPALPTASKSEPLTSAQIVLLLQYTGVIRALQDMPLDKTVIARIISAITGSGFKGIYEPFSKLHDDSLKTKKNLTAILKRLNETDLSEFTKVVEWDLKTSK